MSHPRFHEVSSSYTGTRLVGCTCSGVLSIFQGPEWVQLEPFPTICDVGGARLSIPDTGDFVAVGNWEEGLAGYRLDGSLIWRRSDLKRCNELMMSGDGMSVTCPVNQRGTHRVDIRDGKTIDVYRGVNQVWGSSDGSMLLEKSGIAIIRNVLVGQDRKLPLLSFGILSCCFAGEFVILSEAGTSVRCIDSRDLSTVWAFEEKGWHASHMAATANGDALTVVWFSYKKRADTRIISFELSTGRIKSDFIVPREDNYRICVGGTVAVSGEGPVYDVQTGKVVADLRG